MHRKRKVFEKHKDAMRGTFEFRQIFFVHIFYALLLR